MIRVVTLTFIATFLAISQAHAQRTDDNAVAQAEDAFGTSVGDEQIGIYSSDDVRGFSPESAGNVRIEGLYFDKQGFVTSRILDGSTIHVGISAQGYPFPAPTGISDNSLRKPGGAFVASVGLVHGPYGSNEAEIDAQIPLSGERLGLIAGAGIYRDHNPNGTTPDIESYALSLRWKPTERFEIQPFWSRSDVRDEEATTLVFTAGDYLPPRIRRGRFFGQRWADFGGRVETYGLVTRGSIAGLELALGAFRSTFDLKQDASDLLIGTTPDGRVRQRLEILDADSSFRSSSGEFKLSRTFVDGPRRHWLQATVRRRSVERFYGGNAIVDLGASRLGVEDFRPEPMFGIGPKTRDRVRQTTLGLGYELRWHGWGQFGVGFQKTRYRKRVTDPLGAVAGSNDSPWLLSVAGAIELSGDMALYASHARGLEESDVAPSEAVNRNESPPAIRTQQSDAGLRWKIAPKLTAILGIFTISKPYFNLDTVQRYRQLGTVRNRGIEFSLSGQITPRLTVVAGTLWLDSRVSGEEVAMGLIGSRPVGSFHLRTTTSLNWTVPGIDPLTLTARVESSSARTANAANTFVVPARAILNLGARYKFKASGNKFLVRGDVGNVFNKFGWHVGGSGFFIANGARRWTLSLSADF